MGGPDIKDCVSEHLAISGAAIHMPTGVGVVIIVGSGFCAGSQTNVHDGATPLKAQTLFRALLF